MPIYEFECSTCGEHFDRLQKLSDPDPDACPQCGATGVRRCLTAPSFRLSGSGWYETDFKKDGDKKRNLVDKGESKSTDAKPAEGGKPAESKSAEKNTGEKNTGEKNSGEKNPGEKRSGEKSPAEKKPADKAAVTKPESKSNPAASS